MQSDLVRSWEVLRPHVRPRLPQLGVIVALGTVTAFCQASVLLLFEPIWSEVLFPEPGAQGDPTWVTRQFAAIRDWAVGRGLFEDGRVAVLVALVGYSLLAALAGGLAQYGFTWFSRRIGFQMIVDLRIRLARHLMGLSVRYHGQRRFGDLLSRVSSDVTTTLSAVNVGLKSLIQEPLFALATLAVAAFVAPWPTLGVLISLPFVAWPVSKLTARVRKGSTKSLTSLGASVQALTQIFQGIRTVKAFGGEERELERYRDINRGYLRSSMRMVRAIALAHTWTAFYAIAGFAVLIGILGYLEIRFELFHEGGSMVTFFLAIARMSNHVKSFTKALTSVQESVGASVRIQELLDEPCDVVEAPDARPLSGLGSGIRFEGVTFHYPGGDRPAVVDLDLAVRPGETLALVGPSGAGKSTVVDLVARFVDPTEGRITVDGVDLREARVADWTAQYALVGQVPFLFHASIAENIRYGRLDATDAEIEQAARDASIHDEIAALPEGYDYVVGEMGSKLSGGQIQRLTLARAFVRRPEILLLDEGTSALDAQTERTVQGAIMELEKTCTTFVIAHRLSTVRHADQILVLQEGEVIERGTHEELLARGGKYANLLLQMVDDATSA